MANFVGALDKFNPYIQQIPLDAYTKVGMYKEQQYASGVQKIQENIDNIAGLDIANEGGRNYLRSRVDELTKNLNKYNKIDFSNSANVSNLVGLAKPLYQDENIVNDVINTGVYRNWDKLSRQKMASGDMDAVQYRAEQDDAAKWLNSTSAGATYTGRVTPNDSTYEKINKKFMDFKSKLRPDTSFSEGNSFFYGTKTYNKSQLTELFYNQMLDSNDREIIMNNSMYNDSLRYNLDCNAPKNELVGLYRGKQSDNEIQLKATNLQIENFKDHPDDTRYQQAVRDKDIITNNIAAYKKSADLFDQTDPLNESHKKAIYTNLGAEYYKESLRGMFESEQQLPTYRADVEQSRSHANATLNAAIAKGTVAYTQLKDANGTLQWEKDGVTPVMGIRAVLDDKNDPTILEKESDLITTYDAQGRLITTQRSKSGKAVNPLVTLLQGTPGESATYNVAGEGDIVHVDKGILTDQYSSLDGTIQQNLMAMTKTFEKASASGFKVSDYYHLEQVPGPNGKDVAAMVWTSPEKKKEFMKYATMMNSAYEIEAADANYDNKSFMRFVNGELNTTSQELGLQDVDPKVVQDLLTLKGNTPILGMMDEVFKDKSVVKNLTNIDAAITQKNEIGKSWRKVLFNAAKTDNDRQIINRLTDDDLMSVESYDEQSVAQAFKVSPDVAKDLKGDSPLMIKYTPNGNGTYTASMYANPYKYKGANAIDPYVMSRSVPKSVVDERKLSGPKHINPIIGSSREQDLRKQYGDIIGGLKDGEEVAGADANLSTYRFFEGHSQDMEDNWKKYTGGITNPFGLSNESIKAANEQLKTQYSVIRQNSTKSLSLLDIPENTQEKDSVIMSITNSLIGQAGTRLLKDPNFIVTNQPDVASITKINNITGASDKAVGNFFNNSGFINISFDYQDDKGNKKEGTAAYNIDRILATDPNFASKYSKYFAGLKYGKEGAAIRLQSYINPTEGHDSYSGEGTGDKVSVLGTKYQDPKEYLGQDFTRHIISTSDGHQVPINYRIVSYGSSQDIGNKLNNTNIGADKYAIQLQVNTPTGKKNIFIKSLTGDLLQYSTPEEALYNLKDVMFNNIPADNASEMIKKSDGTKIPNYFSELNTSNPSIRGFFNTMLKLNGEVLPTMEKIKQAYADVVSGKNTEIDKDLLKFAPVY